MRQSHFRSRRSIVCVIIILAGTKQSRAELPSFQGLGDLAGGDFYSRAWCVSPDGNTVVGTSADRPFLVDEDGGVVELGWTGFRWNAESGMTGLGGLPGLNDSQALGVSNDGDVVVGWARQGNDRPTAFRWTPSSGMESLGYLNPSFNFSYASGVSADGSVIVGRSRSIGQEAFQWTATDGMQGLGLLPGPYYSESSAEAVSADGSVIVGSSFGNGIMQAFRWTASEGMVSLGDLPGGTNFNWARAVSADSATIVGLSQTSTGPAEGEGFRWTAATGMVSLGEFPGGSNRIEPLTVSGDGSIIAGFVTTGVHGFASAFIWDAVHGLRDFKSVLLNDYGLIEVEDWNLPYVYSTSADGRTFVGMGVDPAGRQHAFMAQIPEPGTLLLLLMLVPFALRFSRHLFR